MCCAIYVVVRCLKIFCAHLKPQLRDCNPNTDLKWYKYCEKWLKDSWDTNVPIQIRIIYLMACARIQYSFVDTMPARARKGLFMWAVCDSFTPNQDDRKQLSAENDIQNVWCWTASDVANGQRNHKCDQWTHASTVASSNLIGRFICIR